MERSAEDVIRQRLATQRLTSAPLPDPTAVVRLLVCVQAQDAPLARYSVGLRMSAANDATVRAALDVGHIVRTHILRPTWHFVAAEDLRWILSLTSAKVESAFGARHRQLGVTTAIVERSLDVLQMILRQRQFHTVALISAAFADAGLPSRGETVRHLLLVAELRGVVCSAPLLDGRVHTYGLVEELIPPAPALDRRDATRALVRRFFAGHGPAGERDLARWTTLNLNEIRGALADLADVLESVSVGDATLWFDPTCVAEVLRSPRVHLLPTFDEAYLSYSSLNVPRSAGHPRGDEPHQFAQSGGGVIVCDRTDAGWWKRTERGRNAMTVTLACASSLDDEARHDLVAEAHRLAAFFGSEAHVDLR